MWVACAMHVPMPMKSKWQRTPSKDEYLAVLEQRFRSAGIDSDGSVSAAEFATPTGRALAHLLNSTSGAQPVDPLH
jgi:hypothetical protein